MDAVPCFLDFVCQKFYYRPDQAKWNPSLHRIGDFPYYTKYNIVTLLYLRYCIQARVRKKKRAVSCPTAQKEKSIT